MYINYKNLILISICIFGQISPSKLNYDNFFEKIANNSRSSHVKYNKEANSLTLFAYPKVSDELLGALCSLVPITGGIACAIIAEQAFKDSKNRSSDRVPAAIVGGMVTLFGAGCLYATVAIWRQIIHSYRTRNGFVPYLTFDPNGLICNKEYVLKWNEVCKVDFTIYSSIYLNANGKQLFEFLMRDPLIPISYEETKAIFKYCLSAYGNEKFKAA